MFQFMNGKLKFQTLFVNNQIWITASISKISLEFKNNFYFKNLRNKLLSYNVSRNYSKLPYTLLKIKVMIKYKFKHKYFIRKEINIVFIMKYITYLKSHQLHREFSLKL